MILWSNARNFVFFADNRGIVTTDVINYTIILMCCIKQ